jgi:NarL family two-component system response regulator LiaR
VTQTLRVAIVNDFEVIVRGVAAMLAQFHDRVDVRELDVGSNPDHAIDIALFDTYGDTRAVDRVQSLATDTRVGAVVAYTWALPPGQVDAILAAGARGLLTKAASSQAVFDALLAVADGQIVVSPAFARPTNGWPGQEDLRLTARESDVAALLVQGLSNQEIADALCVSEHTVKSHLKAIFQKTGVSSRLQAVAQLGGASTFRRINRAG